MNVELEILPQLIHLVDQGEIFHEIGDGAVLLQTGGPLRLLLHVQPSAVFFQHILVAKHIKLFRRLRGGLAEPLVDLFFQLDPLPVAVGLLHQLAVMLQQGVPGVIQLLLSGFRLAHRGIEGFQFCLPALVAFLFRFFRFRAQQVNEALLQAAQKLLHGLLFHIFQRITLGHQRVNGFDDLVHACPPGCFLTSVPHMACFFKEIFSRRGRDKSEELPRAYLPGVENAV